MKVKSCYFNSEQELLREAVGEQALIRCYFGGNYACQCSHCFKKVRGLYNGPMKSEVWAVYF